MTKVRRDQSWYLENPKGNKRGREWNKRGQEGTRGEQEGKKRGKRGQEGKEGTRGEEEGNMPREYKYSNLLRKRGVGREFLRGSGHAPRPIFLLLLYHFILKF